MMHLSDTLVCAKLASPGPHPKGIAWMPSFVTSISLRVKLESSRSDEVPGPSVVPQSSVISYLLILVMVKIDLS